MGGSVKGLLDPTGPRAGDNAAVVTCTSMASSNFVSATVLDISRKATAIKERVDCIEKGATAGTFNMPLSIPTVGVGKRGAY